jgi:replicative DNA helicase
VTAGPVGGVDYLTAWRERKAAEAAPATRPATPAPVDGRAAYGRAVLDGETARVLAAVEGQRNATLNVAALKVGRAVAGGHVDEDEGRAALLAAARQVGLGPREAAKTVSSGLRAGKRHPRDAGDAEPVGGLPELVEIRLPSPPVGGAHPSTGDSSAPGESPGPRAPAVTVVEPQPGADIAHGYLRPGSWLLDLPPNPPAVWGDGDTVLWAQGEALMLAALPGLGKTTIAAQLVRARLGLESHVFDLPVLEGKRVLYLAGDRPQQIARALRRAFADEELAELGDGLDARLVLGWGPPPADVAKRPELLAELCDAAQADTLVVDSLKDAAIKLTDDEVGASYNRARQLAITAGVEVLELHHLVKRNSDGKAPGSLADVYGSAWLTAGVGSVLVLTGEPGDSVVRALHLKQPREPWGPVWITHDHEHGRSAVQQRVDLLELLHRQQTVTALSVAQQLYETEKPTRANVERARRQLDGLVARGLATSEPGRPGGDGGSGATRYHPALSDVRTPWESSDDDDQ